MPSIQEKEFITGLKNNDKSTVDSLYKHFHSRIYAFAFSLMKVEEDAMDIVHEVFIKLWEKRKSLDDDTKIESLVFTITRNSVLSYFRKLSSQKKYYNQMISTTLQNDKSSTEEMINYDFLKEKVDSLILQLPPKSQKVFILSREKGLSNKEIAKELKIAEKTVEDHITRALVFLKKNLKEVGILGTLFWHLFIC
jgi:RNA polymerase sigma-70 factor (ECF subfamily)